jgi:hypothetical protein
LQCANGKNQHVAAKDDGELDMQSTIATRNPGLTITWGGQPVHHPPHPRSARKEPTGGAARERGEGIDVLIRSELCAWARTWFPRIEALLWVHAQDVGRQVLAGIDIDRDVNDIAAIAQVVQRLRGLRTTGEERIARMVLRLRGLSRRELGEIALLVALTGEG